MDAELTQFQKAQMEGIDSEPFETFILDQMSSCQEIDSEAKLSMFNLCSTLNVPTQSTIKTVLLNRITLEHSKSIIPDDSWPELCPLLYQCLTSTSNNCLKRSAFLIFSQLAKDIGETIVPCAKSLHSPFLNILNDDTLDPDVRIAAISAVISFIQYLPNSNEKERFQDLLPGMMRTLTDASHNCEEAQHVLKLFVDLAKKEPKFFRRQLVDVVSTIFEITEVEGLEDGTRHLAVEFLMTLVEARKRAPGMMKKLPLFISRCFAMLLELLLDINDDPSWHNAETMHDDTGTTSNYYVGKMCLSRFSHALGGKSIAHIAIEQLSDYLDALEWEKRHAALIALACIAEGCSKVMIKNLEQVVSMVLDCFQDPHPRVRCAACFAIGHLLADFSPHLQEQYHNEVFLALVAAVDDFHPRVQACVAVALSFFCVPGKPETLIPHLDGIVNKLLVLLQNDKQMVRQEALSALASIAESAKEHFRTYYDTVMPHLKTVLRNAYLKSNLILHAYAMECVSVVGRAVGKEKFRDDAKQVMEVLMSLQGLQAKADTPPTWDLLITACTRICKCMGQDFLPYMSAVMPFLIQCAQLKPVMTTSAEYWYCENKELDDNSIEKIKFEDKIISKNQDVIEVKARACNLLCCYADILKEDFYPWISQAVSIFVPLLKFYTHNDLRISAVNAMSILLLSAKLAVEKGIDQGGSESYFTKLPDYIILSLVEALHKEHVIKICAIMLDGLNDCLQICGPNEGQVRSIVNEIKHVITESSSRKQELEERAKTEDFDAEEAELLREERGQEEVVFHNVGDILCTLIKAFKAAFLPFLDELSSYLLPMWVKENTTNHERRISIYIFDILARECPEAALKYYNVCLPEILDASNDEDPDVRQNAFYGLGLWAEYGPSVFKPFVGEALSRINVVLTHLNAREPENESAYDNAVSTLGKIYQFHGESIDSAQVIPAWLNCLPIKADLVEAKLVHKQLCLMVERSDRELLGPNYQYLTKVVSVFAEVLCSEKELATKETANRTINILRHLKQTLPPATMESTWSYLLPQQDMELKSILSAEEDAIF